MFYWVDSHILQIVRILLLSSIVLQSLRSQIFTLAINPSRIGFRSVLHVYVPVASSSSAGSFAACWRRPWWLLDYDNYVVVFGKVMTARSSPCIRPLSDGRRKWDVRVIGVSLASSLKHNRFVVMTWLRVEGMNSYTFFIGFSFKPLCTVVTYSRRTMYVWSRNNYIWYMGLLFTQRLEHART